MNTVHPRIAEIITLLNASERELLDTVHGLSPAQRDAPSMSDRWTIAQIVEHIAVVEDGVGRLVSNMIKKVAESGVRETEEASLLPSMEKFSIDVARVRIAAPERVQPRESLPIAESLARLAVARARMIDAYTRASGLALETESAPHPLAGPLNAYQWGLMTALHTRRHIHQIRDTVSAPTTAT